MVRPRKTKYRKNKKNTEETKENEVSNLALPKHSENMEKHGEIRGRHPTKLTHGLRCTSMYFPRHLRSVPIDPDKLAEDIFRRFTLKVLTDPDQNVDTLHTKNLRFTSRDDSTRQYFNQMHQALTYEETAHFCGKFPTIIYSIACRDINPRDIRKTSLTQRCLNYIHRNLAITHRISTESIFITYHYQPQMIRKLPVPETIKGALFKLYTKCRIHCQSTGVIMSREEHKTRYFYRKGTYAYEQMEKILNQQNQIHRLYKLYTLTDIRMSTIRHLDLSRDPKEYEDSYGIVTEQDHHMLFTY